MRRKPKYFVDYAQIARQIAVSVSILSIFVIVYALGTFTGVLHP